MFPGSRDRFGLGFLLNGDEQPGRSANSLAWAGLYNTYYWVDPARDICGVVMTQILPFYDERVVELLARFEALVSGPGAVLTNLLCRRRAPDLSREIEGHNT